MRIGNTKILVGIGMALIAPLFAGWLWSAQPPRGYASSVDEGPGETVAVRALDIRETEMPGHVAPSASRPPVAASSSARELYLVGRASDLLLEGRYPADLVGDHARLLTAAIELCDSANTQPAEAVTDDGLRRQYMLALDAYRPYIDYFCGGFDEFAAQEYLGILVERRDAMPEEALIRHAETAWSSSKALPDDAYVRELRVGMRSTSSPDRFERSALIVLHAGLAGDASPDERERLRARIASNPAIAHYATVLARCRIFGGCEAGTLLAYRMCLPTCSAGVGYGDGIATALSTLDLQLARSLASHLVQGRE